MIVLDRNLLEIRPDRIGDPQVLLTLLGGKAVYESDEHSVAATAFGDVRPGALGRFANAQRKASWARLIQKVYEVDPLKCTHCGATMRMIALIALIDDVGVIERILKHLSVWDPQPETRSPAGPDPPWPKGETIPLTYHPVPDIA